MRNTLPGRLELPTLRLTASRSNQLSYGSHDMSRMCVYFDTVDTPDAMRTRCAVCGGGRAPRADVNVSRRRPQFGIAGVPILHSLAVILQMVPRGLEPRTLRLLAVRSNQLSYETSGESTEVRLGMPTKPSPAMAAVLSPQLPPPSPSTTSH